MMLITIEEVKAAQHGNATAFNRIVLAYRRRVLGRITRIIGRLEDAEDLSQEVFTRLYFSLPNLREVETFEVWLQRITVNAAYDYLRGRRGRRNRREARMADISEGMVILADAAAGLLAHDEERKRQQIRDVVTQLLADVSEEDRILLVMKEVEGLSIDRLAQIYQASQSAMKVRLFRARQRVLRAFQRGPAQAPTRREIGYVSG